MASPNSGIKIVDEHTLHGFDEMNSRETPLLCSPPGRVNIGGQSYFYAADTKETACVEVARSLRELISLARFRLLRDISLIDFATDQELSPQFRKKYNINMGRLFTKIMFSFSQPVTDPEEYLAAQFIADYIRKTGTGGICYMSFFTGKKNYAIFNCHPNIIKFMDSEVVIIYSQNNCIITVNGSQMLLSQSDSTLQPTAEIKKKLVDDVRKEISDKQKQLSYQ